jgi:hypothetical protein
VGNVNIFCKRKKKNVCEFLENVFILYKRFVFIPPLPGGGRGSTIWHTYMKLVTKYQIFAIDSCWEKCDEKYLGRTEGRTEVKQYTPFNNLINTKDSQIPVHQIGTMQQKSVNCLWTAQTKLNCKNYFSNNLQEVCDEKYLGRTEGRTEVKQYTPFPLQGVGV